MINEIIKENETVFMEGFLTTMSFGYEGMYAHMIQPLGRAHSDMLDGKPIKIQTWEVKLNTGERTLARMITWLD